MKLDDSFVNIGYLYAFRHKITIGTGITGTRDLGRGGSENSTLTITNQINTRKYNQKYGNGSKQIHIFLN